METFTKVICITRSFSNIPGSTCPTAKPRVGGLIITAIRILEQAVDQRLANWSAGRISLPSSNGTSVEVHSGRVKVQ
jgi:hypothetical protein